MNIVITGSLGNIGKPLTEDLVQKGHSVTIISSNADRTSDIAAIGAKAAIGKVEDVDFLTATFTGADIVYTMIPPGGFFDPNFDVMAHINKVANNYVQAIKQSGVKKVVHLSSIGAHTDKNNGMIVLHYNVEQILRSLPADVSVTFMRPVAFYYNLLAFIGNIKNAGFMASNYGGDDIVPWVSPKDIAAAIAEEMEAPATGIKVRYVASDEPSCNKIASVLGAAIGMPDLKWNVIPDAQMEAAMVSIGMQPVIAKGLVEMNANMHNGVMLEDYFRNRPTLSKVKIEDYAQEFAAIFNQK